MAQPLFYTRDMPLTPLHFFRVDEQLKQMVVDNPDGDRPPAYGAQTYITDCERFIVGRHLSEDGWAIMFNTQYDKAHPYQWRWWLETQGLRPYVFPTRADALESLTQALLADDLMDADGVTIVNN